ncbi:TIGR02302 family protein [Hwanghaeella sp.]|uniref:TIGR02302 family protein n=1 Tax=Hwanghaeella sp. TaxID=2605943 RepID=UPI003CCC2039
MTEQAQTPRSIPFLKGTTVLWAERLLAAFWPFLTIFAALLALAFSGFTSGLSGWLHLALLIAGFLGLGWALVDAIRRFSPPSHAEVVHHIERANRLEHRPLTALEDDVASGGDDGMGAALWALHKQRMAEKLRGLTAGTPEAQLARRDPLALRLGAGILLVAVIFGVGGRAGENFTQFFEPDFTDADAASVASLTLDAWITPPDYTGAAPIFLTGMEPSSGSLSEGEANAIASGQPRQFAVPAGSKLVAQIGGVKQKPELAGSSFGSDGGFVSITADSFRAEGELTTSGLVHVKAAGQTVASWDITVIPDRVPTADLSEAQSGQTVRGSLELRYHAADDYGVMNLAIELRRTKEVAKEGDEVIAIDLPAGGGPRSVQIEGSHFLNQLDHIWAGEEVWAELSAIDGIDQVGRSDPIAITLPEREFRHPVAQKIIAERKRLGLQGLSVAPLVASVLRQLAWEKDAYAGDIVVFLGLNMAARRLAVEPDDALKDDMIDLLWQLALRLEDGNLSVAEQRLRRAEQALMDAIARDADAAEIERLMQELQQAMDEYLQALMQNAQEQMDRGDIEDIPMDENDRMLAKQDIDQIMERIREMLQNGMKDAARRMLEQLQRMMENLQVGIQQRPSPQGMEAMEMLEGLQELMSGQRELLDRTYRNAQEMGQTPQGQRQGGQSGQSPSQQQGQRGPTAADAALQEALRRQLGDLMQRYGEMMGDIPQPFGRAEQEMRGSTEALRQGNPGNAVGPQGQALDQLQEAARQAQQQFMERFGNQMGQGQQATGQGPNTGEQDPFGRAPNDATPGQAEGDVVIPDTGDLKRAREIRDELRRRASERSRPEVELDYIDRLLRQFE